MVVNGLTKEQLNLQGVIYKVNFPNNKCYIGLTNRALIDRILDHKDRIKSGTQLICKAFRKYGFESTVWEILECEKQKEELYDLEIKHIANYKSSDRKLGYNMTDGGEGRYNSKHTEESLAKISGSNNHGAILNEEQVEYIKIKLSEGVGATEIARGFGVDRTVIKNIKIGKNWKNIRPDLNDKIEIRDANMIRKFVPEIKKMMIEGYSNHEISDKFDIIRQNITAIRRLAHHYDICPELNNEVKATIIKKSKDDLDEDTVVEIKKLLIKGVESRDICKLLNLGDRVSTIYYIKKFKAYKKYGSEYNEEIRGIYGK